MSNEDRSFYTYMTASPSRTIYIGVTGNIEEHVWKHTNKTYDGFSRTYGRDQLVWFERYTLPVTAIAREKQLKRWVRAKKVAMIERSNPGWRDLSDGWYSKPEG